MSGILSSSNGLEARVAHSVTEVGADAWNYLGANHPFGSYNWYRFAETVLAQDLPVYIILYCGGEPVARSTFWVIRDEPLPVPPLVRKALGIYFRRRPLFICRTPLVDVPGIILPAEQSLQAKALQVMAREAQAYAHQKAISFLIYDYLGQAETRLPGWPSQYFSAEAGDPSMVLTLNTADFEKYIGQLSYSTRRKYRRHWNNASQRGITVQRYTRIPELDEPLRLINNVSRHHHSPPEPWARAALENMEQIGATWVAVEVQGKMVSGGLVLQDGDYGAWRLLARDYDVSFSYFATVYEALHCAVDSGVKVLRGGSGAYEFKQSLGFKMEANQYVMATTGNPALRWLGRRLAGS